MKKCKLVIWDKGEWEDREIDADFFIFEDDCIKFYVRDGEVSEWVFICKNENWSSVEKLKGDKDE